MVPIKMEKPPFSQSNKINNNINSTVQLNNNIQENINQIPYPKQIDREQNRTINPHSINQLKEIQDLHIINMNNYHKKED